MIIIADGIYIDENDIEYSFQLSSGPGGQHINKTETAVRLKYSVSSSSLPDYIKKRLIAGGKTTKDGAIVLVAKGHRSQHRNRKEALDRLIEIIKKAAVRQKRRRKTKPTKASQEKRLQNKKNRGRLKKQRNLSKRDIF